MRALSRLGVAAKAAKKAAAAKLREWPLVDEQGAERAIASPEDCEIVSDWVTRLVGTGRMSATDGKVVTIGVQAWLKAHEQGVEAEARFELKALLEQLNPKRKGPGVLAMRQMGRQALAWRQQDT